MLEKSDFKPKMLIAVCFPEKAEWLVRVVKAAGGHGITGNIAHGIKKSSLADLLGMASSKRVVITAIMNEKDVAPLLARLEKELYFEPNTGLAFTINIDAYAGAKSMILIDQFLKNFLDVMDEDEDDEDDGANGRSDGGKGKSEDDIGVTKGGSGGKDVGVIDKGNDLQGNYEKNEKQGEDIKNV